MLDVLPQSQRNTGYSLSGKAHSRLVHRDTVEGLINIQEIDSELSGRLYMNRKE
jgi:hypothetical protein